MNTYELYTDDGALLSEVEADGIRVEDGNWVLYSRGENCIKKTVAVISPNITCILNDKELKAKNTFDEMMSLVKELQNFEKANYLPKELSYNIQSLRNKLS